MLKDAQLLSLDVAASQLGVDTKDLRSYLRKQRPKGAVQIPNKPGGNWHLHASLLQQLQFAGAPGIDAPLRPIDDAILGALEWSEWIPFDQAAEEAPVLPGVYVFRERGDEQNPPRYIGQAGERNGKGLRGRLKLYSSGKGATSGLGRYAMNLALADAAWLTQLAHEAESGRPESVEHMARRAIDRLNLAVRWVPCVHRKAAMLLEAELVKRHCSTLWNSPGEDDQDSPEK